MFNTKLIGILRTLYGIFILFVGFINIIMLEPSENNSPNAMDFEQAVISTGYILQFIGIIGMLSGLSLIIRKFIPLTLIIYSPILLNFLMFKLFLDPVTLFVPGIMAIIHIYLVIAYWKFFSDILILKTPLSE